MYLKLDKEIEELLCCSFCKSNLIMQDSIYACSSCGLKFSKVGVFTNNNTEEFFFDFSLHHPSYCVPQGYLKWEEAQHEYEKYHSTRNKRDSYEDYLKEIDSVREIY